MDAEDLTTLHRSALSTFRSAAFSVAPDRWELPRAPGKWSPRQVAEHVAVSYEQTRRMELGSFSGPAMPWHMRFIARWIFMPLLFRRGAWVGGPTEGPPFLRPSDQPATPAQVLGRLDEAATAMLHDVAASPNGKGPMLHHPVFGTVSLATVLHFLAIHTGHHLPQLTSAE